MKKIVHLPLLLCLISSTMGYGMQTPFAKSAAHLDSLATLYDYTVNKEALKEAITVLKKQREDAELHYNQNKTPENLGAISAIDLALSQLEDPIASVNSFYDIGSDLPETIIIQKILDPIVENLSQQFSTKYSVTNVEMLSIQNIFNKKAMAQLFTRKYTGKNIPKQRIYIKSPEQRLAEFAVKTGTKAVKSMSESMTQSSQEAEQAFAQSLGEGSGYMPRTYKFPSTTPYNPSPKKASEAVEQAERFGIGYQ